jgi:cell division protein FtsL
VEAGQLNEAPMKFLEFVRKYIKFEINLGHVLMIISLCVSSLVYWRSNSVQAAKLETQTQMKIDSLRSDLTQETHQRQDRDKEISESLAYTSMQLQHVSENQSLMTGILQGKGLIDKIK